MLAPGKLGAAMGELDPVGIGGGDGGKLKLLFGLSSPSAGGGVVIRTVLSVAPTGVIGPVPGGGCVSDTGGVVIGLTTDASAPAGGVLNPGGVVGPLSAVAIPGDGAFLAACAFSGGEFHAGAGLSSAACAL